MREPSAYEAPSCATVGGDYWFPEKESGGIGQTEAKMQSLFATRVHTEESVQSGESTMNYTESGVALPT
jgi:hypothetical protein